MLPGNQTPVNTPLQLFFCYNRLQKDILYTNTPMQNFFGVSDNATFQLFLQSGWKSALELLSDEAHSFIFTEHDGRRYKCVVRPAEAKAGSGFEPLLFCEVICLSQQNTFVNREFEELIHLAAHDLDAPLRKLGVLIERLTGKIDPSSEGAAFVPRIEANIKDMRAMIDGLTRLASVDLPGPCSEIDLAELLNGLIAEIRNRHTEKNISLKVNSLVVLEGDKLSFRMLFSNLLENAVVYSKNGQSFIQVTVDDASEDEMKLHSLQNGIKFYKITVLDDGIGFDQRDAEKIFRPFVRLHGKSAYPGSGLGLAICKKIVENHQGKIYAMANENEGARFILFLPQSLN
jgi:signal transduction histidine kinase